MSYNQLTEKERYQIYALNKGGHNKTEIASIIGRHKSTICREFQRNAGARGYRAKQAQKFMKERQVQRSKPRLSRTVWTEVERLIRKDWSPEQISERLLNEQSLKISAEWIYQYIYAEKTDGGDLFEHLRCRKKRKKRYGSYDRRGQIVGRISIHERPEAVESKSRLGDWEGDTVIGKGHKGALATLVERRSLYTLIGKLSGKAAKETSDMMIHLLKSCQKPVYSITLDNGKEFSEHKKMSKKLQTAVYFADPYSSWQRGANENTNGLIRQYAPKTESLIDITEEEVRKIMHRLNHRPRKTLGFKTPYEIFFDKETTLTKRVALTS